jgi:shikimate kinase
MPEKSPDTTLVFLIGFMGSGKSTLGRAVALRLGYRFVDADAFIEQQQGKPISRIFEEEGEARFRELEHLFLKEFQGRGNTIIATGGGTPCFSGNMSLINQMGRSIFLAVPPEALLQRLRQETAGRPLLAQKTDAELLRGISVKLAERLPIYQQAHITLDADRPLSVLVNDLSSCLD